MDGERLRDGIFALRTRRFGSVAECMVKRLRKYRQARSLFHDLFDERTRQRIEVKFSTVQQKAKRTVTDETVLDCIEDAISEKEPVPFSEWRNSRFDCNIQQVKREEFDVLYYGLFFSDCVQVFRINSSDIKTRTEGGEIGYSDKQHKGNVGEGQFHITNRNLQTHLDRHFHKKLTYDELCQLLAAPD
jgi:activator of HSP90 ATPase